VELTSIAQKLFGQWQSFLQSFFIEYDPQIYKPSLFIDKKNLEKSHYLEHFPQQLLKVNGETSLESFITPAGCLHLYPNFANKILDNTQKTLLFAQCGRFENGQYNFPFRLASFSMTEFIVLGTEKILSELRNKITENLIAELLSLKFNVTQVAATDAFFLAENKGAQLLQKMKGLKIELVAEIEDEKIALVSINNHESYFGDAFKIRTSDDQSANSFCVAFGVERLVAYSLLTWGIDHSTWPNQFKYV